MIPREQHNAQQRATRDDRVRYVEDLASPEEYPAGDAWISLTDAARVTRTSEAMARRWVTSGRLPVKRQPAGINQHTRLVRISDVATIRPIIDPTAAISDDVRKLDLPSIPRQQFQIMEDQERLTKLVHEVESTVSQTQSALLAWETKQQQDTEALRHTLSTHEEALSEMKGSTEVQHQQLEALAELINDNQRQLVQLRSQTAEQVTSIGGTLTELQEALHSQQMTMKARADQEQEQRRLEIAAMATELREALSHHREALDALLVERQREVEQLRQALQEHTDRAAKALQVHREQIETLLEQRSRQVDDARHRLHKEVAADRAMFTRTVEQIGVRLRNLDTSIEVAKMAAEASQRRVDKQDELIADLKAQLTQEQQERSALAQQVATLVTHIAGGQRPRARRKQTH